MMAFGSSLSIADDAPVARKSRGAFFTPPEIAAYLVGWAIASAGDKVLEPACGEAEFLIASHRRLAELGADAKAAAEQVVGCELHAETAKAALERCAKQSFAPRILVGDFLKQRPIERFDAVVGNPPYVRFQVLGGEQKQAIREVSHRSGFAISSLASAWAPFVMHAASFLVEGGRLAFVLPAELLAVNYAASIRSFLLSEFSDITIVTFDERVFPEVQEEVVLLLAGGYHKGSSEYIKWIQASGFDGIDEGPDRDFYPQEGGGRWTSGLVASVVEDALGSLASGHFCRLGDWGSLTLGAVTGNNKFFALSADEVASLGLGNEDVVAISPPGSRHLRRVALSNSDYEELVSRSKKAFLFYPGACPSAAAKRYIEHGLSEKVDQGYKCRNRKPWWKVPIADAPDAFVTYMNDYSPSVCANGARVRCLNSVHGLTLREEYRELGAELFALACVNSITMLSAELEGRAYGGGLLKVEPREAASLQVPSPQLVESAIGGLQEIACDLNSHAGSFDLLQLSYRVDQALFDCVSEMTPDLLKQLRESKKRLYERRRNRGRA